MVNEAASAFRNVAINADLEESFYCAKIFCFLVSGVRSGLVANPSIKFDGWAVVIYPPPRALLSGMFSK